MSNEMLILKDLAVVTATRKEWLTVTSMVNQVIKTQPFADQFNEMASSLSNSFRVTVDILRPFTELSSQSAFDEQFEATVEHFQQVYLAEVSKPRHAADACFELYLELQQSKEFKSGYPLLKYTFARLDYMVDKYVTNDAWLVMHIDAMIRRLSRVLVEYVSMKKADSEDTFQLYHGLMTDIASYLDMLESD